MRHVTVTTRHTTTDVPPAHRDRIVTFERGPSETVPGPRWEPARTTYDAIDGASVGHDAGVLRTELQEERSL